ncbi:MAG: Vitamin B12 transporter BtuB [Gemmatimonadaceae bacterium]|nr:Vitamin B12 transporter BtuB [Gemmatimonadaceae bacterium]
MTGAPGTARRWCAGLVGALVALALSAQSGVLHAQARQLTLAADTSGRADFRGGPLSRRVTIHLTDAPLEFALQQIAQAGALRLSYSSDLVPLDRRVSIARDRTPVGEVLREVLRDTDVDVVATPAGYVVLVRMPAWSSTAPAGRENQGEFAAIAPRPAVHAQVMDRVLVMGTPALGAPERELPTAVTVLTSTQIGQSGARSMEELFRTGIPGVVAWNLGIAGPFAQIGSVRGSSSFTSNYLKAYVDGVELASPYLLFSIDPASVERIEVIRGPQGSALYGSDAISGVVQVITRHGRFAGDWRPQGELSLSGGVQESRFMPDVSFAQRYVGFASSGGQRSSLGFGGSWDDAGGIVPGGGQGYRGAFGAVRHVVGALRLEGTMRYADVRFTAPENPLLATVGADMATAAAVRPQLLEQRIQTETYGLLFDFQPLRIWRQSLILGLDRHAGAIPAQGEVATGADALLGATDERVSRSSLRYSTVLSLRESSGGSTTLTLGAERSLLARERLGSWGNIFGQSGAPSTLYSDRTGNSGLFAQARVDLRRALFVTAGIRREQNTSFGPGIGAAWSPMVGASFTRDLGSSTLKMRGAYGKGLRPPPASARRSVLSLSFRQVENPLLAPESQSGFEGGIEWYAGDRASLSLTAYHQNADGLVQQVLVGRASQDQPRSIQYQNVGRIENTGMEAEGAARIGRFRAAMSLAVTDSRVRALSPSYSGDLAVGDRVPEVPTASGLGSLTYERGSGRVTFGASYIGSWTGYDWIAFYGGEVGSLPRRATLRQYQRRYPSLVKPYVSVSQGLMRGVEWFARMDNIGNSQRNERDNLQITAGRTTTVGLRLSR